MSVFNHVGQLESKLKKYIDTEYYAESTFHSYVDVSSLSILYDDETREASLVDFNIYWGRAYKDDPKNELNESNEANFTIPISYIDNYDFILGVFVSKINE